MTSSFDIVSKTEFDLLQTYYIQEKIDHVDLQLKHRKLIEEFNKLVVQLHEAVSQKQITTNKTGQKKKRPKKVESGVLNATSGEN